MSISRLAQRVWVTFSWQMAAAILVSMLTAFGYLENPWLDWLGWFGYVGGFVAVAIARFLPAVPLPVAFFIGFSVNVALWTAIFKVISRTVARLKRRPAIDSRGAV